MTYDSTVLYARHSRKWNAIGMVFFLGIPDLGGAIMRARGRPAAYCSQTVLFQPQIIGNISKQELPE